MSRAERISTQSVAALRRPEEEGVTDALERVQEAGQRLLMRRLELLLERGRRIAVYAGIAGIGVLLAVGGWALVVLTGIRAVDDPTVRTAVGIAVGVAHMIAGGLVIVRALRATNGDEE